jgi:hypothetical protein
MALFSDQPENSHKDSQVHVGLACRQDYDPSTPSTDCKDVLSLRPEQNPFHERVPGWVVPPSRSDSTAPRQDLTINAIISSIVYSGAVIGILCLFLEIISQRFRTSCKECRSRVDRIEDDYGQP